MGFFLMHVLMYMQEYGQDFQTQPSWVSLVTLALEGAAARWMVTLHNADALELQNFDHFMMVLRCRFEDPLADHKACDCIRRAAGQWLNIPRNSETSHGLASKLVQI